MCALKLKKKNCMHYVITQNQGRVRHKLQDSGHLGGGGDREGQTPGWNPGEAHGYMQLTDNILNIPAICHTNVTSPRKPSLIPVSKSTVPTATATQPLEGARCHH